MLGHETELPDPTRLFAPNDLLDHPALTALDEVERLIDWQRIDALLPQGAEPRRAGRPGYPAQTLFRALLLGLWYDLSDVRLADQLARDLLFRKFCRLELDTRVPDDTTLCRFRGGLGERLEAILAEVMTGLEASGVVLAEGRIAIVDATVVEAARSSYRTHDPEAGARVLTVKGRQRAVWGWQAVVNAGEDGFIRRLDLTPGNASETNSLERVVVGDEAELYADAAYPGPRQRALCARHGIADRVQRRNVRGHPLSPEARERNAGIAVTRGRVEAIFGHWKRLWGLGRTRYLGLARVRGQMLLAAVGWNLWKGARFRRLYG